jgi:hypothetical protein
VAHRIYSVIGTEKVTLSFFEKLCYRITGLDILLEQEKQNNSYDISIKKAAV